MTTIQISSPGQAERLPGKTQHFLGFFLGSQRLVRTRLAAFANRGAHWGSLVERLLQYARKSCGDAEMALSDCRMTLNDCDPYDAIAGKGLRADQFMDIVRRQCFRRSA